LSLLAWCAEALQIRERHRRGGEQSWASSDPQLHGSPCKRDTGPARHRLHRVCSCLAPRQEGTLKCRLVKAARTSLDSRNMASVRLFRVILPVSSIEGAAVFYSAVLGQPGVRISPGRHYFGCGSTILACFDPRADGDPWDPRPNPDHIYFAVDNLHEYYRRVSERPNGSILRPIETQPWGERSFYCMDPFGNKLCFVAESTMFTGGLL
jgi:predicted enzyme related to lactoylglutathione lyase